MKKYLLLMIVLLFFSCEKDKPIFVQSSILKPHYLIKNPPKNSFLLPQVNFYKYTSNTKYFLDKEEDPGGFSSEELVNYPEDKIAVFTISKCEKDSTKLVGRLYFYKDNFFQEILLFISVNNV